MDTTERLSGRSSCLFTVCLVISPAPPAPGPALERERGGGERERAGEREREVELQAARSRGHKGQLLSVRLLS